MLSDNEHYKILFYPKRNSQLLYKGFIIVDKLDFGIYELEMQLQESKKNKSELDNLGVEYNTKKEFLWIKYKKIEEQYELVTSQYDIEFSQTKGGFKGEIFINKMRLDETLPFSEQNLKRFSLSTYKLLD